ncbi:arsenate reductase family protein [Radiobacillus deserti]|uniref:Arsenate reductase family protein n=1 Tax=Radiobacillus deserti TaxID=2594883 RepID=A0A516KHZ8_9BACI|nr:arsenate reductase family protein [Radiobacillus deserti]QDP41013.1 arsenate reductase family protein [Radiobacillus deserti]
MSYTFYWYPKCGTCVKAKKWLDEHGKAYEAVHIVENPPSAEDLKNLIEKSGLPIKKFFNTSGRKYKELGLKDKLPNASEQEMIDWLASDGMLIKRPILTDGKKVTVGFKQEQYEETWA